MFTEIKRDLVLNFKSYRFIQMKQIFARIPKQADTPHWVTPPCHFVLALKLVSTERPQIWQIIEYTQNLHRFTMYWWISWKLWESLGEARERRKNVMAVQDGTRGGDKVEVPLKANTRENEPQDNPERRKGGNQKENPPWYTRPSCGAPIENPIRLNSEIQLYMRNILNTDVMSCS